MTLKQSNPYLRRQSDAERRAELRVSAQTSSAVEGIRAPFSNGAMVKAPKDKEAFIAFWRRRAAGTAR